MLEALAVVEHVLLLVSLGRVAGELRFQVLDWRVGTKLGRSEDDIVSDVVSATAAARAARHLLVIADVTPLVEWALR